MSNPTYKRLLSLQRGATLLVSLVMLALISLFAVNGMSTSTLDQVLANNQQAQTTAFAMAEWAVADGETEIETNYSGTPAFDWSANTTDGFYGEGEIADIAAVWDGANGHEVSANNNTFVLEYLGFTNDSLGMGTGGPASYRYLYRVTGRGVGGNGGVSLLQTIYATAD